MKDSTTPLEGIEEWESLTLSNDYMFYKIMQDESLLTELIHRILPSIEIGRIEIREQKTVEIGPDIHGVRFDIFVRDTTGRMITIEMQVVNQPYLPKRLRYYSSIGDTQVLEKGMLYSDLPESYVIVICPFDFYEKGLHKYTFRYQCKEIPELSMNDGTTHIVLNAMGTADDIDRTLRSFLDYIAGKKTDEDDPYIMQLENAVKKARMNKEWRRTYMTLAQRDMENQREGETKGRTEFKDITNKLNSGMTAEELIASGYPIDIIQEAQEFLSGLAIT